MSDGFNCAGSPWYMDCCCRCTWSKRSKLFFYGECTACALTRKKGLEPQMHACPNDCQKVNVLHITE